MRQGERPAALYRAAENRVRNERILTAAALAAAVFSGEEKR